MFTSLLTKFASFKFRGEGQFFVYNGKRVAVRRNEQEHGTPFLRPLDPILPHSTLLPV